MRKVLIVAPTRRDLLNLVDGRVLSRYDLVFEESPGVAGVFGSSDSTAALATVVAERLGLPGSGYDAFMRCHDKLVCRRIQAEAVPEAVPAFAAIDTHQRSERAPLSYPFFIKPVQGHLSQYAYAVDGPERLAEVLAAARRAQIRYLIAEELLEGRLVTFEGFASNGEVTPIGVTDAVMHENGISFLRFEYPSSLPEGPQREMAEIASRLMPALGFDGSLFNIEFFVGDDGGRGSSRSTAAWHRSSRRWCGPSTGCRRTSSSSSWLRRPPELRQRATAWWPPASCCRTSRTPSSVGPIPPLSGGGAREPTSSCSFASASVCRRTTTTCCPTGWRWSRCQGRTASRCSSATRRPPTSWSST